jgi:hypothetical protein
MIKEDIHNRIIAIRQMNMSPHRIYIGRETMCQLVEELGVHRVEAIADYRTIYGVPYFEVNVAEHLDVTMVMPV